MAAGNDIEYECLNCGNVTRRPSYWGLPLTCKCPEPRFKTLSQVTFEKKLREMAAALIGHLGLGASPERINLATSRLQSAYALGQQDFNEELLELLKRALEELRLIRVKYYDAVFDHGIRSGISIAIERASALHREQ